MLLLLVIKRRSFRPTVLNMAIQQLEYPPRAPGAKRSKSKTKPATASRKKKALLRVPPSANRMDPFDTCCVSGISASAQMMLQFGMCSVCYSVQAELIDSHHSPMAGLCNILRSYSCRQVEGYHCENRHRQSMSAAGNNLCWIVLPVFPWSHRQLDRSGSHSVLSRDPDASTQRDPGVERSAS